MRSFPIVGLSMLLRKLFHGVKKSWSTGNNTSILVVMPVLPIGALCIQRRVRRGDWQRPKTQNFHSHHHITHHSFLHPIPIRNIATNLLYIGVSL